MLHGSVLPLLPENLNLLNSRKITKGKSLNHPTSLATQQTKYMLYVVFLFCVSEKYLELEKTFRDLQNSYHSCVRLLNSVFVNMVKNTG